jgi:hypothetical protein
MDLMQGYPGCLSSRKNSQEHCTERSLVALGILVAGMASNLLGEALARWGIFYFQRALPMFITTRWRGRGDWMGVVKAPVNTQCEREEGKRKKKMKARQEHSEEQAISCSISHHKIAKDLQESISGNISNYIGYVGRRHYRSGSYRLDLYSSISA